jgi:hypothetical protein
MPSDEIAVNNSVICHKNLRNTQEQDIICVLVESATFPILKPSSPRALMYFDDLKGEMKPTVNMPLMIMDSLYHA